MSPTSRRSVFCTACGGGRSTTHRRANWPGFTDRQLAKGCLWSGDAGLLREALMEAGFVDRETGELHDWREYTGRLIEKRETEAERKRSVRAASGGRPADAPQVGDSYLPTYQTNQPNRPTRVGFHRVRTGVVQCRRSGSTSSASAMSGAPPCRLPRCARSASSPLWASGPAPNAGAYLSRRRAGRSRRPAARRSSRGSARRSPPSQSPCLPTSPRSTARYPERLIEQLAAAKRQAQRSGADSSGEPERLAVSGGRPS